MRVAAVQLTATADKGHNLTTAGRLVAHAADLGAELVALPELWNQLGPADLMRREAESLDGPTLSWARDAARVHRVWLLAGSITEQIDDRDLTHNTSCLVGPDGRLVAAYRKIHLFDNEVPGAAYHESATVAPGDEVVTAEITTREGSSVTVGLVTCYDLRFPEIFRILALRGAELVLLPSAFTFTTGADHWEVLVRARAMENQVFVVAPNQTGRTGAGVRCWGHSTIVDPWGTPLASSGSGEAVISADLDLGVLTAIREQLPSLANRRPGAYHWPDGPVDAG